MTKLDKVMQIKQEVLAIQSKLMSSEVKEVKAAMKKYEQLVDWYYRENGDLMAPQQYETAKKDFEYFMRLIDLAEECHKEG